MIPELPPNPRQEQEARITALLLEELSSDEAAAIREMIAKDPELQKLQDRLSQTLGLLRETVATPANAAPAQPAPLKLSPERHEKLLAQFKTVRGVEFEKKKINRKYDWIGWVAAAAMIMLLASALLPSLAKSKQKAQRVSIDNYLRQIQMAKQSWAEENNAGPDAVPTAKDLEPYLGRPPGAGIPNLSGETYYPGSVRQPPMAQLKDKIITLPGEQGNLAALDREQSMSLAAAPQANRSFATPGIATHSVLTTLPQQQSPPAETAAQSQIALPQNSQQEIAQRDANKVEKLDESKNVPALASKEPVYSMRGVGYVNLSTNAITSPTETGGTVTFSGASSKAAIANITSQGLKDAGKIEARTGESARTIIAAAEQEAAAIQSAFGAHGATVLKNGFGGGGGAVADANVPSAGVDRTAGMRFTPSWMQSNTDHLATRGGANVPPSAAAPSAAPAPVALPPPPGAAASASAPPTLVENLDTTVSGYGNAAPVQQALVAGKVESSSSVGYVNTRVNGLSDVPLRLPALPPLVPLPEVMTSSNAFTTFSLNISDVAFKLAAASLEHGEMPEAAAMRSEEFINAFDYRDPEPPAGAPIGFAWERAADPFAQNRDFVRFSIKTSAQGRAAGRRLNLVLLLDKSGSMERADRVSIISNALAALSTELRSGDTLSVVTFANSARLFADGVPGSEAGKLAAELRDLSPEGGTDLEQAMKLAYAVALRHYLPDGENRVVLLTDGAANLGNVDPAALKKRVEANRKQGIALDCFGVGWDGYNDDMLEQLSRAGNGRYAFINTPREAATEFAGKLAGALRVAAADVKVQVEFNPNRVIAYREIGYAKDQLKTEDFRDNSVKAAQMGAAESGNALYTVQINPAGDGPLGVVRVRYRDPATGNYEEHEWNLPYSGTATPLDKAGPAMRLAAVSAEFCEWLGQGPYSAQVTSDELLKYLNGVPAAYGADPRPQKLEWMIREAKSITGK